MFKEEFPDLDQNLGQERKTYAEMSEDEKVEFKEQKERELKVLKDSLVEYGIFVKETETEVTIEEEVEGVGLSIAEIVEEGEKKLKLIIEQECGEGIWGLGKSDSSVWMCLDHEDSKSFEEKHKFDANTNVDFEKEYQGIIFKDIEKNEEGEKKMKIRITADHPVLAFANFLGKNKDVYLPGGFNGWDAPKPLEFNEETGELEGIIVWDKKKRSQCKIAIHNESKFDNGGWKKGADQEMKINLGEE